jgi:LPXTG-site transpeptidase (sortase) family protein
MPATVGAVLYRAPVGQQLEGLSEQSSGVVPVWLSIPKLGVEARVVGVGEEDDGAMASPSDPDEVAWYALGPGMGVNGNVVFAGHVNWGGSLRVFGRLDWLTAGDTVLVIDADGNGYQYVVESSRWVRADEAELEQVFGQEDSAVITLITCGGEYVAATREYLDRLVVRARGA